MARRSRMISVAPTQFCSGVPRTFGPARGGGWGFSRIVRTCASTRTGDPDLLKGYKTSKKMSVFVIEMGSLEANRLEISRSR